MTTVVIITWTHTNKNIMSYIQFLNDYDGEPLPTMTLLLLKTADGGYTIIPNGEPITFWQLEKAKAAIEELLECEGIEEQLDEWNKRFER